MKNAELLASRGIKVSAADAAIMKACEDMRPARPQMAAKPGDRLMRHLADPANAARVKANADRWLAAHPDTAAPYSPPVPVIDKEIEQRLTKSLTLTLGPKRAQEYIRAHAGELQVLWLKMQRR